MKYRLTGSCFLAGVHPSSQRIERTVEAPTAEAAAEQTFKRGFHAAIYVVPAKGGFTAMYGGRACGSVKVEVVS